ncbi:hypothetical protein AeMF1_017340, partial [Aphanomyces euteiches]
QEDHFDTEDADWYNERLYPMASIEWIVETFPKATETQNNFSNLRITRVTIGMNAMDDTRTSWKDVLPRLSLLTSLLIANYDGSYEPDEEDYHAMWNDLFEFVVTSDLLNVLQTLLKGQMHTDANLTNLMARMD